MAVRTPAVSPAAVKSAIKGMSAADRAEVGSLVSWGGNTIPQRDGVKTQVLIVGGSVAQGLGSSTWSTHWWAQLWTAMASTHTFTNEAVPSMSAYYWMNQNAAGAQIATGEKCNLERVLLADKPDICIIAFSLLNGVDIGDLSDTTIRTKRAEYVDMVRAAIDLCGRYGVAARVVTPYMRGALPSKYCELVRWCEQEISSWGVPVIDLSAVMEVADGSNYPANIDSGDNTHVNDLAQTVQRYCVPRVALSGGYLAVPGMRRQSRGTQHPDDVSTVGVFTGPVIGPGSWSVAFSHVGRTGTLTGTRVLFDFGADSFLRLRITDLTNKYPQLVDSASPALGLTGGTPLVFDGVTVNRIMVTYSSDQNRISWYLGGVLLGSATVPVAPNMTSQMLLGGLRSSGGFNAQLDRFADLCIWSCELKRRDAVKDAAGVLVNKSLRAYWPMTDGAAGKIAGGHFVAEYGRDDDLTTAVALP